ncbi:MarR family transcriptional regulator [uncultured Methanolobus sp.]|uniref:MarR family winged helix-turn-helix transcriptional regulator n=1 Tax=uncultured Methanolobus sp. TaxID=218300 RepID=UPI0029C68D9D|nr:MarR family transcriptional regulator [uncultured Methanolobus sp.]
MFEKTEMQFSFEKLDEYYNRLLKEYEFSGEYGALSLNAYLYLKNIHTLGTPSLSELARTMDVTKPSASAMVHKLANKGLLIISPHPGDKRVTLLSLTEKGAEFIKFQDFADTRLYTRIREILDDSEFSVFVELWQKIDANLEGGEDGK